MAFNDGTSSRILWIDLAKAIGIWLVVLGHAGVPPHFHYFIFAFHMPLFFFISGYLEKDDKSLKETALSGVKTLLVPYALLSTLRYLYWLAMVFLIEPEQYANLSLKEILLKPALGILVGLGRDTDCSTMLSTQMWFIMALFWVKLIHSVVISITHKRNDYYIIGIGFVIGCVFLLKYIGLTLWFSVDCAVLAFPFLALGYILRKTNILALLQPKNATEIIRNIAVTIAGFVVVTIAVNYNGKSDINNFNYGADCMLFYILGIVGIISTISLSMLYTKQLKIITTISSGTIIILFAHIILNKSLQRIVISFGIEINLSVIIIVAVANVLFMAIPIKIVQRYAPILMGKYK